MNAFIILGIVGLLTVLLAMLFAGAMLQLDTTVTENYANVEADKVKFDTKKTGGYKIELKADYDDQQEDALEAAAKRAAMMERGANMGIGRLGSKAELKTASDGVKTDAITAFKIASKQGWDNLGGGRALAKSGVAPAAAAAVATGPMVKRKLVAGKDYAWTDYKGMPSGIEKRSAIIACLLYTSPSPRDLSTSRMPSSA